MEGFEIMKEDLFMVRIFALITPVVIWFIIMALNEGEQPGLLWIFLVASVGSIYLWISKHRQNKKDQQTWKEIQDLLIGK